MSAEIIGFKEEIAGIQTAIADFETGHKLNIAIISEPFAGRTTLVNEIERINNLKVTRLSFSSVVKNSDEIILHDPSKRIVIIDYCHFLYMRKIGGFDVLQNFLKLVASSNNLFITTWNLYSWKYLDAVMDIGRFFPIQINLSKFTTNEIKESILSMYKPGEIKFVEDAESEKENLIDIVKYPVTIKPLKKSINIIFLKINYQILKNMLGVRLFKKKVTIEDIIFQKINKISNGNPGVSKVVWQKSLNYPVIKPSMVKDFSFNIELNYNESFILSIILSMRYINKEELAEIVGPEYQMDEILFRLVKQGLVAIEGDYCSIRPEALRSTVDYLKKLRLVW